MKTATMRDLRQRFNEVVQWIETGEEIAVTRRGVVVATLGPPKPAAPPRKVNWAGWLKAHPPVGKGMSAEATEALWSRLRD